MSFLKATDTKTAVMETRRRFLLSLVAFPAMPLIESRPEKVRDPVCGPLVEKDSKLTVRHVYASRLYYFCSNADRDRFMKNPQKYLR